MREPKITKVVKSPKAVRKNLSEYGFIFKNSFFAFIPAHEVSDKTLTVPEAHEDDLRKCHIYLVLKRKRFAFNPITLSKKELGSGESLVSGHISYRERGQLNYVPFEKKVDDPFRGTLSIETLGLDRFYLKSEGQEDTFFPASLLAQDVLKGSNLIDYEVLYVGMAFGKNGERGALDRLKSHSTLQAILGSTYSKYPDEEVWICAIRYDSYSLATSIDGRAKLNVDEKLEADRFSKINDYKLSKKEIVCMVEAGLIAYFKPQFNETYKVTFPKRSQKILDVCYDLDVSGMVVELEVNVGNTNLFSQGRPSGNYHLAKYDFFDPAVRAGFGHITFDGGVVSDLSRSGPIASYPKTNTES